MILANQWWEQIVNERESRLAFALPHLMRKEGNE